MKTDRGLNSGAGSLRPSMWKMRTICWQEGQPGVRRKTISSFFLPLSLPAREGNCCTRRAWNGPLRIMTSRAAHFLPLERGRSNKPGKRGPSSASVDVASLSSEAQSPQSAKPTKAGWQEVQLWAASCPSKLSEGMKADPVGLTHSQQGSCSFHSGPEGKNSTREGPPSL